MINLSLDELRLIAQIRNISSYENKSQEDLIKALSEPKPGIKSDPKSEIKLEPKLQIKPYPKPPKKPKPKPEIKLEIKPKQTLKPQTKLEVNFNGKILKKLRKDFDELEHKFLNKDEISEYRKAFYNTKKYKSESFELEIEKTRKNLNKLKKFLKPQTKLDVKFNRKKLEKLKKDFDELRHTFSNKDEINEYRKDFYSAKKHKLFESEIEKTNKNLNKLKKA